MNIHTFVASLIAIGPTMAHAQVPSYLGHYESTPKDTETILQVTTDFQAALLSKDTKRLSSLLLNTKILFSSPAAPARVKKMRDEVDIHFDGIDAAGAANFIAFVAKSLVPIEEKFYNIKITQDRHLAWVMFDFEFLEDGKVQNHGVETWQMLKTTDDSWKIFSVVWSSHGAPK